jgi:hypothetical protein
VAIEELTAPSDKISPVRANPAKQALSNLRRSRPVVAFDNLSYIPDWLSDAFCRLSTGGGFSTRALYTDDDEIILDAKRPVIITAIEDILRRDDLAARALFLHLKPITNDKRKTEAKFWEEFDAAAPALFGALLDALAGGLELRPTIELRDKPRMADFALWGEAVCRAIGETPGAFLTAYTGNRQEASEALVEDSPVAVALRSFMADKVECEDTPRWWRDTLTNRLSDPQHPPARWPKRPRGLSGQLRRLAPALRAVGLSVAIIHGHIRQIRVTRGERVGETPSQPSQPSQSLENKGKGRDGCRDGSEGQPSQPSQTDSQPSHAEPPRTQGFTSPGDDCNGCDGQIPTLTRAISDDPPCGHCFSIDCEWCQRDSRPSVHA